MDQRVMTGPLYDFSACTDRKRQNTDAVNSSGGGYLCRSFFNAVIGR